jgi:XTP/dITP diphosphohydrolase
LSEEVDGVFADDTGLEISALGGLPGVRTARWAGDDAVDVNNRQKALRELEGKTDRSARFRTVVTLIMGGEMQQVKGIVNGRIAQQEEGEGGFGYDPVFIPEGYDKTFASLSAEVKNSISHRGRAMEALKEVISNI